MESFADRLAREIIRDVKNDIGQSSDQTPNKNDSQGGSIFNKLDHRPHKRLKGSQHGFTERKRRGDEDSEIDILADRLTSEIIDYATSSGKINPHSRIAIVFLDSPPKGRKKERRNPRDDQEQMEIYSDSTQPASEYQKTVIKYQNSDATFSGTYQ